MKKFIALVALVLVSASTMMYAQESNAAARRAERKAQRDAERAKLRAEEEVQDMACLLYTSDAADEARTSNLYWKLIKLSSATV